VYDRRGGWGAWPIRVSGQLSFLTAAPFALVSWTMLSASSGTERLRDGPHRPSHGLHRHLVGFLLELFIWMTNLQFGCSPGHRLRDSVRPRASTSARAGFEKSEGALIAGRPLHLKKPV